MKDILKNKYIKIGLSAVSVIYAIMIIWLSVNSFLYKFVIDKKFAFLFLYSLLNLAFLVVMYFSRKEIATSVVAMVLLPFVFVLVVMNLNNLLIAIPPFIVCVIVFFVSNANKTLKTVLGAIYILLYVLGIIIFLVVKLLFGSSVESTVLDKNVKNNSEIMQIYKPEVIDPVSSNTVSPNGKYRYYVVDVKDKNLGRVDVYVEPNNKDKIYSTFSFIDRGHERKVSYRMTRGNDAVPQIKWVDGDTIQYTYKGESAETTDITPGKKNYFSFFYN